MTYNGSLMTSAVHRDGDEADWFRSDLDLLLAPYRRHR